MQGGVIQLNNGLEWFYKTKQWKSVAHTVRLKYRGVCQKCGHAGSIVHHIIHLNVNNVSDPSIAYGLDNLTLLCTSCHNETHGNREFIREGLEFDEDGFLVKIKTDPPTLTGYIGK